MKIEIQDIIAYHHTKKDSGQSILAQGFDFQLLKRVSIGFGIQCFLEKVNNSIYAGTEGQIVVEFNECKILKEDKLIKEMRERIEKADDTPSVAIKEAEVLRNQGVDAYIVKVVGNRDCIVFLNPPKAIKWIDFDE